MSTVDTSRMEAEVTPRILLALRHLEGRPLDYELMMAAVDGCVAGLFYSYGKRVSERDRTIFALEVLVAFAEREARRSGRWRES